MSSITTSPAFDIATLLQDKGVGVLGQDIFVGGFPQSSNTQQVDRAVAVFDIGGINSLPIYQRDEMLIRFQIQGNVEDYRDGYNFANEVKEAVNGCKPVTINEKDYIQFIIVGDINSLGLDDNNRPRFTLTLRITRENFGNSDRQLL